MDVPLCKHVSFERILNDRPGFSEENSEVFDDISAHSIIESDTKIVVQSNNSNVAQTYTQAESDKALGNMLRNLDDKKPRIKTAKITKKEKASFAQMLDGLDDKTYKCYFCDKVFCKEKFVRLHRNKHLDQNGQLPCKYCNKTYPTYRAIMQHIIGTHKPVDCKECNKTFFSHTSYLRHQKTIHVDQSIKKFKCDLCSYESHAR